MINRGRSIGGWLAACAAAGVLLGACARPSGDGPLVVGELARSQLESIELVEAELKRGSVPSGRIIALYFDPAAVKPLLALNERDLDLSELAGRAIAVSNAGFFTPERRATGLLVSRGKVLSPFVREGGAAGSGVFIVDKNGPQLIPRDRFDRKSFEEVAVAIQAGPRIIEPGGAPGIKSDDGLRANRTVIGRDRRGRMVIAALLGASGWQSGPTLFEVQELLGDKGIGRAAKELAFEHALNLDGGPSTGLYVRAGDKHIEVEESAPVHSVLFLGAKP